MYIILVLGNSGFFVAFVRAIFALNHQHVLMVCLDVVCKGFLIFTLDSTMLAQIRFGILVGYNMFFKLRFGIEMMGDKWSKLILWAV